MSLPWITINKKLLEGIALINLLSSQKFKILLKRIFESDESAPFTLGEIKKLGSLLQLEEEKSILLVQSLTHTWNQAVKFILKPVDLQKDLELVLKLDTEKAEEFTKMWIERIKGDCGDLNKRKKLNGVSWQVNLQAATNYSPKEIVPTVKLKLQLSDIINSESTENVVFDLNEEEIVSLYNAIEGVQIKIDELQSLS
ncbi:COMM domain-containing protein 10 [Onthophagus taurus]|uniref:COMM domain-containing protein 10 n=1 Tax=Onthophagus taurus TaxID=166361 RepID=UPI0039BE3EC0